MESPCRGPTVYSYQHRLSHMRRDRAEGLGLTREEAQPRENKEAGKQSREERGAAAAVGCGLLREIDLDFKLGWPYEGPTAWHDAADLFDGISDELPAAGTHHFSHPHGRHDPLLRQARSILASGQIFFRQARNRTPAGGRTPGSRSIPRQIYEMLLGG